MDAATMIAEAVAVLCLCAPSGPFEPADRGDQVQIIPLPPPPTTDAPPTGVMGLPFAPDGLTGCDEMAWYRAQFGLPAVFDRIGWRESNCRNEDGVRTSCCHGYWQLSVTLHLSDHRIGWRYRDVCGVDEIADVNSATPIDRQRQACATKQLYDVMGMSPW